MDNIGGRGINFGVFVAAKKPCQREVSMTVPTLLIEPPIKWWPVWNYNRICGGPTAF